MGIRGTRRRFTRTSRYGCSSKSTRQLIRRRNSSATRKSRRTPSKAPCLLRMFQAGCGPVFRPPLPSNCSPLLTPNRTKKNRNNVLLLVAAIAAKRGPLPSRNRPPMRYRIPADPRRKEIRKRAQAACKLCALPRTVRNSSVVRSACTAAHDPQHFRRAICAQCRVQAALFRCAMPRTMSRTSRVQTVRNVAHRTQLFRRAVCVHCRAQSAAQCSASSRTIGCRCNLPPSPRYRNRH